MPTKYENEVDKNLFMKSFKCNFGTVFSISLQYITDITKEFATFIFFRMVIIYFHFFLF